MEQMWYLRLMPFLLLMRVGEIMRAGLVMMLVGMSNICNKSFVLVRDLEPTG